MVLTGHAGTSTSSGSYPFATPYQLLPGFVMAAAEMLPITPASAVEYISPAALTDGDDWSLEGFVSVKYTSHATPAAVPLPAAVSTSLPVPWLHTPDAPSKPPVLVTASAALSPVLDPVSPVTVTVDPASMS
eukprot:354225-Hanusia_phi.AAC.1